MVDGWDSPAYSGGNSNFARGFGQLILRLGLDKSEQALVLLRSSKELKGDAASADRMDHPSHFKRRFRVVKV